MSQSFPWWGTLDARRQVARADAEATAQDLAALRLRLAALARGAFADWVYVHRAIEINTANLAMLDELGKVARVRYTTAQAPQEDVLQADVERAMLKEQRLEWERNLTMAQERMNALLERAPESAIPSPGNLPAPSALPAEEVLAQRALAHPRLEELADEERAAEARQRLAEKERFPKLGVSTGYNSMWADPAMRPMVGLSITVPIGEGKYRAAIDAAHADARRAASILHERGIADRHMPLFIRGRLRPESENPISRGAQALYLPVLRFCLRHRKTTLVVAVLVLTLVAPLASRLGSEFMPPLFEGSALYMPTALPGISITQASQLLQEQDRIICSFPEVKSVFGTVGRSDSATDNAPFDMYDTTVMLKPRCEWPAGTTYTKLIEAMDAKLRFPGLTNTWTMPVENRLDMELTGIKTPVGMKIQGPSLEGIQRVGAEINTIISGQSGVQSVFAERVAEGFYINIAVKRAVAARYGLTVGDVQRAIESGIGGENIAENVEGRERFPVNVRYNRDFRDDIPALERVVVATPSGAKIPLGEIATISFSRGPSMIRDEEGQLTGYVYRTGVSRDGVKFHVKNVLAKLDLPNRKALRA